MTTFFGHWCLNQLGDLFKRDDMHNTIVIVNPAAGRGAGARLTQPIADCLHEHGLEFDLVTTTGAHHATRLTRDAVAQGRETVVSVGGDGTFNEVLNGLVQTRDEPLGTALGLLPVGTGNDFAFGAGLPLDLWDACQVVAKGQMRSLDIGLFRADNEEPRYFGNGIGIGFDAMATIESRKIKRLRGALLYLVAVIRTLAFYYDAPRITLCVDGEERSHPSLMISVMNGRRMGGGFYMTPTSEMDDGLLDLCVAGKVSRPKMIRFVPRFMRGTHTTDPDITMGQGQKVIVVSESPWAAQLDGEIYGVGASRYEVELLPQRLRLIC
jgi:YegS/Rv2252/BmrU family lipid kinase